MLLALARPAMINHHTSSTCSLTLPVFVALCIGINSLLLFITLCIGMNSLLLFITPCIGINSLLLFITLCIGINSLLCVSFSQLPEEDYQSIIEMLQT